ncbi:response regulator [Paenibacillus rhizoplanae]
MGGAITVESVVGEGSNFYFILPVDMELELEGSWEDTVLVSDPAPASEQISIPEEGESAAEFGPLRILVAEDHPVNQKLLVTMLDKRGYAADLVDHGEAAVQAVLRERYDLVFMDVQMPGMSGLTATARIREQAPAPHQPYIAAVTAYARKEDRERCYAAGMDDFVSKPFLAADIDRVLEHCSHRVSL